MKEFGLLGSVDVRSFGALNERVWFAGFGRRSEL